MGLPLTADTTYGPSATSLYFSSINPADQYGVNVDVEPANAWENMGGIPGLARSGGPGVHDNVPPWSPANPLFWFGIMLATTLGLVAASTSVKLRVGPLTASGSLGAGKK